MATSSPGCSKKHPEIKALMIAVHAQYPVSAYVLVPGASAATCFADLKGKDFSVPRRTKEHCRVFVERHCQGDGVCASMDYFSHIVNSANVETALDDLFAGKFDAAIVDSIGLDFYKELQPGRFNKLKILKQSEAFPPAVIAYRQGGLDEPTLARVRDGLSIGPQDRYGPRDDEDVEDHLVRASARKLWPDAFRLSQGLPHAGSKVTHSVP